MGASSLSHKPEGGWAFDESVAEVFDDMLVNSIPLYQPTLDLIADFVIAEWKEKPVALSLLSLGVGSGVGLEYLLDRLSPHLRFAQIDGFEYSPDMIAVAAKRFSKREEPIELIHHDLNEGLPDLLDRAHKGYEIVLYQYTSQFVAPESRSRVLSDIRLNEMFGMMFMSEKTRGESSAEEEILQRRYHQWKRRNGYSREAVATKAKSLRNVLMPMTSSEIERMLILEGFQSVPVARYLQFETRLCWRGSLPRPRL